MIERTGPDERAGILESAVAGERAVVLESTGQGERAESNGAQLPAPERNHESGNNIVWRPLMADDNQANGGTVLPKGLQSRDMGGISNVVMDVIDEVARSTLSPDKKLAAVVRGITGYTGLIRTAIAVRNHERVSGAPFTPIEGPKSEAPE